MSLGEKIADLRKANKLSQEDLAEKVGVARQTISKWELEETAPDIKQAQELSRIFNISLDELVGNDINNIVVEKISNTERLAGMIIKILKVAGIIFIAMLVIEIVALVFVFFFRLPKTVETWSRGELTCVVDENKHFIEIESTGIINCQTCEQELSDSLEQLIVFNNYNDTRNNVMDYFERRDIKCELKEY